MARLLGGPVPWDRPRPLNADSGAAPQDMIAELLDAVALADEVGLDGWYFPELHGGPEHSLSTSPNLLIAAAAQRTQRTASVR
jgi:alkanesulfonate monooxygenase SsuD/methylene tetrahydromethanopterin reductase-like flavin-dependent oxidoreductase (luciferase family)